LIAGRFIPQRENNVWPEDLLPLSGRVTDPKATPKLAKRLPKLQDVADKVIRHLGVNPRRQAPTYGQSRQPAPGARDALVL